MSVVFDNIYAYKAISLLGTPFIETEAYKLGIIDANGKMLKKAALLKKSEKRHYTYFHRIIFNLKKLINKFGGENKIKNVAAALFLLKEYSINGVPSSVIMESDYKGIIKEMKRGRKFLKEEYIIAHYLTEDGEGMGGDGVGGGVGGGAPVNSIGDGSSVGMSEPVHGRGFFPLGRTPISRRKKSLNKRLKHLKAIRKNLA